MRTRFQFPKTKSGSEKETKFTVNFSQIRQPKICAEVKPVLFFSPRHPFRPVLIGRPTGTASLPSAAVNPPKPAAAIRPFQHKRVAAGVPRNRNKPCFNITHVLHQIPVLFYHITDGLAGNHGGDFQPPVRRISVEPSQSILEPFVLLRRPFRRRRRRKNPNPSFHQPNLIYIEISVPLKKPTKTHLRKCMKFEEFKINCPLKTLYRSEAL